MEFCESSWLQEVQCTKYNVLSTFRSTIWVSTRIPTSSFNNRSSTFDIKKSIKNLYLPAVGRRSTKYPAYGRQACKKVLQNYHLSQNTNPHFFIQQSEFDIRHLKSIKNLYLPAVGRRSTKYNISCLPTVGRWFCQSTPLFLKFFQGMKIC